MAKTKEACRCKEGGSCKSKRALFDIHCHQCGRFLAAVPMSTWTRCPDCRRWSRIEPETDLQND